MLLIIFLFLLGAMVGSFVNVVSIRYNTGLSFVRGSSVCLSCNTPIPNSSLIPLFSYISQRARCVYCKSKFSIQYFLIELFSGLLLVSIYLHTKVFSSDFFLLFFIFELLILIFIYDLKHKIIPDAFVYIFIALSVIYSLFFLHSSYLSLLYSAIFIPLPFFLIWYFSDGRLMGFGDIKLMVGIGALLGLGAGITAVFISFWAGALCVIIMYMVKAVSHSFQGINMQSEVPFGPFLVFGIALTYFCSLNLFQNLF